MSKHEALQEGQLLLYKGKEFEQFDSKQPYMDFLGYDSNGWSDLWVNYNGTQMRVEIRDVEPIAQMPDRHYHHENQEGTGPGSMDESDREELSGRDEGDQVSEGIAASQSYETFSQSRKSQDDDE